MFKKITRLVLAEFDLCAAGPVLISSGKKQDNDPTMPDTVFLTGHNGEETAFVIPGSTIKGVISSYVYRAVNGNTDIINELFGKLGRKSKISFHDAYADMSTIKTSVRYSTALDRILQSAKGGSLNDMQVVEAGSFNAGFRFVNPTNEELKLIVKALKAIDSGMVRIGGRTSRGFGAMKINNLSMRIYNGYDEDLNLKEAAAYNSLEEVPVA